jgi:Ca2+-transporting ATPase
MRRPPRDPEAALFTAGFVWWSLLQGAVVLTLVAVLFMAALHRGLPEADARALAFAALVATNAGLVLVNRSGQASLLATLRQPNPTLWCVLGITSALLAGILLIPAARELFAFGPLHADDAAIALLAGLAAVILLDVTKGMLRPGRNAATV